MVKAQIIIDVDCNVIRVVSVRHECIELYGFVIRVQDVLFMASRYSGRE